MNTIWKTLLCVLWFAVCCSTRGDRDPAHTEKERKRAKREKRRRMTTELCSTNERRGKYHFSVGFFGMSRSLSNTIFSLRHHVFNILSQHNYTYDVFWHTLIQSTITNNRSAEYMVKLNRFDSKHMDPCKFSLEDNEIIRSEQFQLYLDARNLTSDTMNLNPAIEKYDLWKDNYQSVKNVLCSYYSQSYLARMIRTQEINNGIEYDGILILRPDVVFFNDIDLPEKMKWISRSAYKNVIWVPRFQAWGGYNDRFAFGSTTAGYQYLERGKYFRDNMVFPNRFNNGETFLKEYLKDKKILVQKSTVQFARIRADGKLNERDIHLMKTLDNNGSTIEKPNPLQGLPA